MISGRTGNGRAKNAISYAPAADKPCAVMSVIQSSPVINFQLEIPANYGVNIQSCCILFSASIAEEL
jgi:hypothetical protein